MKEVAGAQKSLPPQTQKEIDLSPYDKKMNELENIIKDVDTKINDYEFDKIVQNINLLMENQNDNEMNERMNNLESVINEVKEKVNKSNGELRKSSEKTSSNITNDLINKINNIEDIINIYDTQFQKIEEEKKNNNNYKNNSDKRADKLEKRIANVSKQSDDLEIKTDQLFTITKNLENITKELNKKTDEIISNIAQISSTTKDSFGGVNKNPEKLRNIKKNASSGPEKNKNIFIDMNDNKGMQKNLYTNYSKGSASNNNNMMETNNGYQVMIKSKDVKQKYNYEDNQFSNTNTNKHISNVNDYNYIDSKIVNYDDIIFLKNRIKEIHPKINTINFNLVYRASEDGDKAADFHNKCDKIGPNITLIKTKKGYVFGGFTFKNWEHMPRDIDVNKPNLGSASRDSRAFGFCVNNQKIYNNEKPNEFAIWCNRNFGPTFKNNLFQIFDSCLRKGGYCSIKSNSHFGGQNYDYEISGGESRFRVEELEVYEVKLH